MNRKPGGMTSGNDERERWLEDTHRELALRAHDREAEFFKTNNDAAIKSGEDPWSRRRARCRSSRRRWDESLRWAERCGGEPCIVRSPPAVPPRPRWFRSAWSFSYIRMSPLRPPRDE